MTSGTCNRLFVATGAVVALALSHPVAAQNADDSGLREAIRRISFTSAPAGAFGAREVTGTTADDAAAGAKPDSSIVGTVHDPSGAAVTGAELTIKNLATDQVQTQTSDASGAFDVQNLAPGSYQISAAKSGFRDATPPSSWRRPSGCTRTSG